MASRKVSRGQKRRRIEDDQHAVEDSTSKEQETPKHIEVETVEMTQQEVQQFIEREAISESDSGEEEEEEDEGAVAFYSVPEPKRVALLKMRDLGHDLCNKPELYTSVEMYEMLETENSTITLGENAMEHVANKEQPKLPLRQFWQTLLDAARVAQDPDELAEIMLGLAYDPDEISKRQIARHRNLFACFGYTIFRKSRYMVSEDPKFRRALCEPWKGRGYKEYKRFMESSHVKKSAGGAAANLY